MCCQSYDSYEVPDGSRWFQRSKDKGQVIGTLELDRSGVEVADPFYIDQIGFLSRVHTTHNVGLFGDIMLGIQGGLCHPWKMKKGTGV